MLVSVFQQSEDSPAVTGEDSDDDDDEDLEALRLAALQSLKAKSKPGNLVQSHVPPTGPTQVKQAIDYYFYYIEVLVTHSPSCEG